MNLQNRTTSLLAGGLLVGALLACNLSNTNTPSTSNTATPTSSDNTSKTASTNTNSSSTSSSNSSSSTSGVYVEKITLAKDDGKGGVGDEVDSFSPSDHTMHLVAHLSDIEKGTKVKVRLVSLDGSDEEKVGEVEKETGRFENEIDAYFTLPRDWPKGKYRADTFVNDKADKTREFEVE